jgi:hypothetical protein
MQSHGLCLGRILHFREEARLQTSAAGCARCRHARVRPLPLDERADIAKLSKSLRQELTGKGLQFIEIDQAPFREALGKTTFYKEGISKFGNETWAHLEKTAGKLV